MKPVQASDRKFYTGECIHSFLSPHLACYLAYYLAYYLTYYLAYYLTFLLKINQPGCNSHFNYGYDFKYNKPEFDKHLSKRHYIYLTRITLIPQCREYFKLFKTQRKIELIGIIVIIISPHLYSLYLKK